MNLASQHFIVRSPLVGVFYRSPSPSAPPFIEVGEVVEKGETICIIEAMKVMNEITAEKKGKVVKVFPKNGEMVEFDSPLFEMEAVTDEA
jgi:acetyl-CoA carboxylase biotin carboxyl carrier protein